jgi:hypothetical protein
VKSATHRPLSPRRRWPTPHRRHPKKHDQGQCQKQPTRQESASRSGQDGWEDRDVGELIERFILLDVNNLLLALHNLKALIHYIQTLISAPTCGKDTPEHLQDVGVGSRSRGAPPIRVVREGAAAGAIEEPAREALGSLGTTGRRES